MTDQTKQHEFMTSEELATLALALGSFAAFLGYCFVQAF